MFADNGSASSIGNVCIYQCFGFNCNATKGNGIIFLLIILLSVNIIFYQKQSLKKKSKYSISITWYFSTKKSGFRLDF
jgi:hypothetical protein